MNKFKAIFFTVALVSLCCVACDDEEEDDTKPYLEGTVYFEVPEFVSPGSIIESVASGAKHPESGDIGYCWKISGLMDYYDTTQYLGETTCRKFRYQLPDSIGTFTLYCYAFSNGDYYPISRTQGITTVNETSVVYPFLPGDETITDSRDGSRYRIATIGNHQWICQNVHYSGTEADLGLGFRLSEIMGPIFGRYYSWNEAQEACPEGWRVPSEEEWTQDAQSLTNEKLEPLESWSGLGGHFLFYGKFNSYTLVDYWPEVVVTNSTKFSALPFGYATERTSKGAFKGMYDRAVYWTSSTYGENYGLYRTITTQTGMIHPGYADKDNFLANVRCIKDL